MARGLLWFDKSRSERLREVDVEIAQEMADELVRKSRVRLGKFKSKVDVAKLEFDEAYDAWLNAGGPRKGKLWKAMKRAEEALDEAEREYDFWDQVDLDHTERRVLLNEFL